MSVSSKGGLDSGEGCSGRVTHTGLNIGGILDLKYDVAKEGQKDTSDKDNENEANYTKQLRITNQSVKPRGSCFAAKNMT